MQNEKILYSVIVHTLVVRGRVEKSSLHTHKCNLCNSPNLLTYLITIDESPTKDALSPVLRYVNRNFCPGLRENFRA